MAIPLVATDDGRLRREIEENVRRFREKEQRELYELSAVIESHPIGLPRKPTGR